MPSLRCEALWHEMKAILEFNLPEDSSEHLLAVSASELYSALCEIDRSLRNRIKHGDLSDETRAELEAIRELIPQPLIER